MLNVHSAAIEAAIHSCAVVATHNLNTVQLSPTTGYMESEIMFVDGSRLVFFEFLRQMATGIDREKYRYHFTDASNELVFRYDNAPHHRAVATFPRHKHLPTGVTGCSVQGFADVLAATETHILKTP